MPVTHQWKAKSKTEDQTAAAAASPTLQPAAGKKGTQADESSGKKGSAPSSSKKKDEKQPVHPDDDDAEESGGDEDEEEDPNQPGRIRNLAGFFATQRDEPKEVRKKRFAVDDDPETIVLENEPERLEGVIRADDPGEWQKPIELEKGWAKNLANRFLSQQQEDNAAASKKPFVMDIEEGAQTIVLENEPVVLEGVVRSVDKTEDVIGKRGRIKNIAGRFANPQADDAADRGGSSCWREPVDFDAARTRGNVADKWKNQRYDEPSSPTAGGDGGGKPKWMLELESAKEYGVFENEPEVRSDVVRADDEQPDVISAQHTRNLRKMWSQIEREEVRDAAPSKRPDILIRPKKKEPSPEPEPPPPPPVEETKPGRRFGAAGRIGGGAAAFGAVYGGRQAKKEKTPPPPEPEPPKQQQPTRRGFRQVGAPAQTQPPAQPVPVPEPAPPTPDPKNPFKTALKPVPRRR